MSWYYKAFKNHGYEDNLATQENAQKQARKLNIHYEFNYIFKA